MTDAQFEVLMDEQRRQSSAMFAIMEMTELLNDTVALEVGSTAFVTKRREQMAEFRRKFS